MVEKTIVIKDEIVTRKYLKATHVRCDVCGKELEDFVYDLTVWFGGTSTKNFHSHVCGRECFDKIFKEIDMIALIDYKKTPVTTTTSDEYEKIPVSLITRIEYKKVPVASIIENEKDPRLVIEQDVRAPLSKEEQIKYYTQKLYELTKESL